MMMFVFSLKIAKSGGTIVERWFIGSASIILIITGIAKVWTAFGSMKILAAIDPVAGIQLKYLVMGTGVIEIVIAALCLFSKNLQLTSLFIAWLATGFLIYRSGLWSIGYHKPCPCLGNLTDALHISPQTADTAMKIILAYLLLGSYATLFWLWRQQKYSTPTIQTTSLNP